MMQYSLITTVNIFCAKFEENWFTSFCIAKSKTVFYKSKLMNLILLKVIQVIWSPDKLLKIRLIGIGDRFESK